jgi:predicted ester cyclase
MHSTDSNKQVARRYLEDFWNGDDVTVIDELVTPDVVGHPGSGQALHGPEVFQQRHAALRQVYSEPHFSVEDLIAEGDKALLRWSFAGRHTGPIMGAAPTGKQITVGGMNMFRFVDGKIAELWVSADDLGELQQLGVIPGA